MKYLRSDLLRRPELRRIAVDWCNGHGINPNSVPMYAAIEIDDDYLDIQVYDTTAAGLPQWDTEAHGPKLRWLRVKCNQPFPEECLE